MCEEQDVSIVKTTLILTLSNGEEVKHEFDKGQFSFAEERSSYCIYNDKGELIDIVQNKQRKYTLVACKGCNTPKDFKLGIDVKVI